MTATDTHSSRVRASVLAVILRATPQMTQSDWATVLGVSGAAVSQWLAEVTRPRASHLRSLLQVLRSRSLVDRDLVEALELEQFEFVRTRDGSLAALARPELEGLETYASDLHPAIARLLRGTVMQVVDSLETPRERAATLVAYVGNSRVDHSPGNWHFGTLLGSLSAEGARSHTEMLIALSEASTASHASLSHAGGWAWTPVPALAYRYGVDAFARESVIESFTDVIENQKSYFFNYRSLDTRRGGDLFSTSQLDGIASATHLLGREHGQALLTGRLLSALRNCGQDFEETAGLMLSAEVLRRGRTSWLSDDRYRVLVADLAERRDAGDLGEDSEGRARGLLSQAVLRRSFAHEDLRSMIAEVLHVAVTGSVKEEEEDSDSRQLLLWNLFDAAVDSHRTEYEQYLAACGIYDLLGLPPAFDSMSDRGKRDPFAYEYAMRCEKYGLDRALNDVGRLTASMLVDIYCMSAVSAPTQSVAEYMRMSPAEKACSLIHVPTLWRHHDARRQLAQQSLSGAADQVMLKWLIDSIAELYGA